MGRSICPLSTSVIAGPRLFFVLAGTTKVMGIETVNQLLADDVLCTVEEALVLLFSLGKGTLLYVISHIYLNLARFYRNMSSLVAQSTFNMSPTGLACLLSNLVKNVLHKERKWFYFGSIDECIYSFFVHFTLLSIQICGDRQKI